MLFMLNNPSGNICFYITDWNNEYVVGRKDCKFLINDDASVSRKHAMLKIKDGSVILRDAGSRFKTFRNKVALIPGEEVVLAEGDEVQFGAQKSKFKFNSVMIRTTGSRLSLEQNQRLRTVMKALNGCMVDTWDEQCTHLTVHELMLSVKVLHAVLDEKPIVSVLYWDKYLECVQKSLSPPSVDKLKPPMAEALLSSVSLDPDHRRQTLFKDKVFVFVTEKAMAKMEGIIRKAGGTCISWQKTPLTIDSINKSSYEYLILQGLGESSPEALVKLTEQLQKQGKRCIPVQEIAMAIVTCSVQKDCNSRFKRAEQVFKKPPKPPVQSKEVLAKETQSQDLQHSLEMRQNRPNIVINSSLDADGGLFTQEHIVIDSQEAGPSCKRQQDVASISPDHRLNPPKRMKQELQQSENSSITTTQTTNIAPIDVKSEIIDVDEVSISTDVPKHGAKRKSEESPTVSPKKRERNVNPFALSVRENPTSSTADPFISLKESEVVKHLLKPNCVFDMMDSSQRSRKQSSSVLANTSPDLPDTLSRSQPKPPSSVSKGERGTPTIRKLMSSTMNQQPSNRTLETVNLSRITKTNVTQHWVKKGIKKENEHSRGRENMDQVLEEYCNSFRDCVIITPMEWYPKMNKKPVEIPDSLDGNVVENVTNFKKFRKVKPMKPQTIVLYCMEPTIDTESQQVPDDSEGYTVDNPAPASRRCHGLTAR